MDSGLGQAVKQETVTNGKTKCSSDLRSDGNLTAKMGGRLANVTTLALGFLRARMAMDQHKRNILRI